jgi:hypothetical protein
MTQPTTFNPNVPLKSWSYSQWQPSFLTNFQQLYKAFQANHEPLDAASNAGNHTNVQLYDQPVSPTVSVSEMALFAQMVTGQTDQVFLKYQDNKTQFPLTNYQIYTINPFSSQIPYFTSLPGGIILYFGTFLFNQGTNDIYLQPTIAKNILSVCFTNIQSSSGQNDVKTPGVGPVIENGIITKLTVLPLQPYFAKSLYYMVMANT